MRIVCPVCSATYDVPHALLRPAGRKVRCAKCGTAWAPVLTLGVPAEAPDRGSAPAVAADDGSRVATGARRVPGAPRDADLAAPATPLPMTVPARLVPARTGDRGGPPLPRSATPGIGAAIAGWLVTLVVLAAAGYAAYAYRSRIEAAWPPVQRVYGVFGLR